MAGVKAQELAERLLAETREEVRRADSKALTCLQLVGGGGFTLLLMTSGTSDWRWWAAGVLWTLALLCLASAITPRLHSSGPVEAVTYFGHIVRLRQPSRVRECIEAAADDNLTGTVTQLCASSRIAIAKFRLTRLAVLLSIAASALTGLSLI